MHVADLVLVYTFYKENMKDNVIHGYEKFIQFTGYVTLDGGKWSKTFNGWSENVGTSLWWKAHWST